MKHLFLLLTLLSFSLTALAQQKVTGKVKDSSGEPVIGASVVVKGNNTMGTITDFDGNFMLDVPAKSVLVISYIGVSVSAILSCRPFFILIFLPYIKMNHYGFSRKSIWKNLETFP